MTMEESDPKFIAQEKRAAKKQARQAAAAASFKGFVNASPTEKDKELFNAWLGEEGAFSEALDTASSEGWKFTVTWDSKGECYRATAAIWDTQHPSSGLVLSLRAGEALRALARCVWWLAWKCDYKLVEVESEKRDVDAW